ncbi:tRNA (guanosine(37)-N1)-methyltransferase TrmD [Corynebacterium breve]|uniref:tRNA (guanine-N(1)-)-methyltransferase n=1 Tax=Corynebacterium breve TaxID=3049799 RepID=A0ABY8VB57_9CORY|nr:tRNA (guanosine(37)-N1)-methyltransferase TrmD [Corynebacterium breve]WIM66894.1 tRNA (guanosine(37)-N1)-methyltransferase TrmD [Corynebacterium breve]
MSNPALRLDIITIFPEYLEPLRHALLGKAIEEGRLEVGVHDLRDWAMDRHKSVDDTPLGGGPGMVMKPEVWGPALDDVAAGRSGVELSSASEHRNDRLRHDEVEGVTPERYEAAEEDRSKPLLLVPTPAGQPFTQADAREWSNENHIVIACGRYEGIDQRVFEDAENRYRVREVSIGDYVLIGGEVAALVIAEAVTRLIPGVLGNASSHEEDSFSDGLLEGPSYTKPREWRGLAVPEVLLSGDHAKIARWRRDQSLLRTKSVRPELLDDEHLPEPLSREDLFTLNARDIATDISVLITPGEWERVSAKLPKKLRKAGFEPYDVNAEQVDLTCEPDNILVNQYEQAEGHQPTVEVLHRVIINGRSDLDLREATQVVVRALPEGTYWYGSTDEGRKEPGVASACAWNHQG